MTFYLKLNDVSFYLFIFSTELQLGELVHHQKLFGLFEAMSAIEMMDPKMDAGMCCNKNAGGPLTFDTAIEVRFTKETHFSRKKMYSSKLLMSYVCVCVIFSDKQNEIGSF